MAIRFRILFLLAMCYNASIFIYAVGLPYADSYPRDLKKLKGKIKFLAAYNYTIARESNGNIKAIISDKSYVAFHKSGNTIISEKYGEKNRITEYYCRYDHKGRMSEMEIWESIHSTMDKALYLYKYDNQNREIESMIYKKGWSQPEKIGYTYLPDCNKVIKYEQNTNLIQKSKIDTLYYDLRLGIQSNWDFTYLKNGVYIEKVESDSTNRKVTLYNKRMDIIQTDYYRSSDNIHFKKAVVYDEHFSILTQKSYQGDSLNYSEFHHYTYDKTGNWTLDSIYVNDKLTQISKREFEYYK